MFLKPEMSACPTWRLVPASWLMPLAAALLLAGCAVASGPRAATAGNAAATPAVVADVTPSPPTVTPPATDAVLVRMLAYAQRVRLMTPAELNQEVARMSAASGPSEQMQLSLVLSQLLQLPELVRAQELLGGVLANPAPEAQALHTLADLLASRYGELRRLEEQLEKQTQQTREVQRRLDQTHERLEALKAIERSLTSRPPAANASAPTRRGNLAPAP